ncbi:MAG: D-alanine--D-alanine ligase [Parcubacteria group bacterium]|jgi:D-alanine-D-alanine ligase
MKKTERMKKTIAIIFGGKSAEHDVSIQSAHSVLKVIDKLKYNVILVGIDKKGRWFHVDEKYFLSGNQPFFSDKFVKNNPVVPCAKNGGFFIENKKVDAVFPLVHGTFGEDGALQGFFKIFNVPFVGADITGSSIGMDKDVTKRLLREAKITVADYIVYKKHQKNEISFEKIKKKLGLPFFVKPASLGSSVGIKKVKNKSEFEVAIKDSFSYGSKIIIEEFIEGRELECSVLGNGKPIASIPGEIILHREFYSYEAKYLDENAATLSIPAKISKSMTKKIQSMALKVFETLCCEGMGRVDFFITKNNQIFVNEINTVPGFTSISMYPKLWEYSGIPYPALIDKLIELAIDRHNTENKFKI